MDHSEQKLKVNALVNRLELEVEGAVAFIEYKLVGDRLFLIHTEVPVALRGKGTGTAIVQKALEYAKENNYKIVPICPFVQSYLQKHEEWSNIIASDAQKFIHSK